jgi:imidazolonepropionase-like amidohydrolase
MMNKLSTYRTGTFLLLGLSIAAAKLQADGPLAIQGAKIIPIVGEPIAMGTILIRDGKIEAVGKDIAIPGEAKVIDATGKVVMPGFVDAHNAGAMTSANERNELVPFLSVVDSIDPISPFFDECRRNGITSSAVVPGNSTLIGGQAAIVKTAGQYVNDMLLKREAGLKISLRPASGNRMSQLAKLRKELDKAKKSIEKEAKGEKPDSPEEPKKEGDDAAKPTEKPEGGPEEPKDGSASSQPESGGDAASQAAGLEALKKAIKGEQPVYIYCETGMDVTSAIQLISDYGLKPIFVLGPSCYKAVDLLAKRNETVILDPSLVFWETNQRTREDKKIIVPQLYRDAKVPFLFQTEGFGARTSLGSSYFWFQAATAVKYGMPEKEALEALTIAPAKRIGIEKLVGSIEVGKDADLVILTGEPLNISTWVDQTIIDGKVVYERSKDEKIKRLLSPVAE